MVASQGSYFSSNFMLNVLHQVLLSRHEQGYKSVQINGPLLAAIASVTPVRKVVDVTEERNHCLWVVFVELDFLRVTLLWTVSWNFMSM
jgi:hypothetical protein